MHADLRHRIIFHLDIATNLTGKRTKQGDKFPVNFLWNTQKASDGECGQWITKCGESFKPVPDQ